MKNFLKQSFIAGLIIFVLASVFWWIVKMLWRFLVPFKYTTYCFFRRQIPGLEIVFAIIIILLVGIVINIVFKRSRFKNLPKIRKVISFFVRVKESSVILSRTDKIWVLIKWNEDAYSVGITTKAKLDAADKATGKDLVAVFLMSTPFPTSGVTLLINRDRLIPLSNSRGILSLITSGGLLSSIKEDN